MDTTEHIVESYVRFCKGWFTNSNIKTEGNKEIDILAIDRNGRKYWIECQITIQFNLFYKSKRSPHTKGKKYNKWQDKNGLDYFKEVKFNDHNNIKKVKEFGFKKYKKIIVVWKIGEPGLDKKAKKEGYIIWELRKIIPELLEKTQTAHYPDDILRTIQLTKIALDNKNKGDKK